DNAAKNLIQRQWGRGLTSDDLKHLQEVLVIAPRVRSAVWLSKPNNGRLLSSASQNSPDFTGAMHRSCRFALVIAKYQVATQSHTVAGASAATIFADWILRNQFVLVLTHDCELQRECGEATRFIRSLVSR